MPDTPTPPIADEERRRIMGLLFAGSALAGLSSVPAAAQDNAVCNSIRNPLLWAVAYKQTAAEFRALCHQTYNLARMRIDHALAHLKHLRLPYANDENRRILKDAATRVAWDGTS